MDHNTRTALLNRYASAYDAVVTSLLDITPAELDRQPAAADGTVDADAWTARQVVHHLADSETNSYVRLRKLIAEDNTEIQGYDEPVWATRLYYGRPIGTPLDVLKAVRESSYELLESLTEEQWLCEGTHSSRGRYTMAMWLEDYAEHPHEHADQIDRARLGQI